MQTVQIDPRWIQLIKYCQSRPFCTIKELEIKDGAPANMVYPEELSQVTKAFISVRFVKNNQNN